VASEAGSVACGFSPRSSALALVTVLPPVIEQKCDNDYGQECADDVHHCASGDVGRQREPAPLG